MKTVRALIIGIVVWVLGVSAFTAIYELSLMEDRYLQANIGLALIVPPLVWMGAWIYYKKIKSMHGLKLGVLMLLASASLDALITVPVLIMPYGGSYASFFGSLDFWLIAFEFVLITVLYWHLNVRTHQEKSLNRS
ncbi:DUF5367 family protein [Flagellimonas nanhaiensis]|uniref:DUF5367 domain-containing protein n=1 Tax=Flagellimonas nanhaiensis TaxID=2292706 RepID=A0A371JNZ4_9FLAO|nr:DUF5367 family protein [Allomuricauda nanhaiensis]RDY59254.1 hypothetical protein DX873_07590 [Allomuricauda nanhaiensis]